MRNINIHSYVDRARPGHTHRAESAEVLQGALYNEQKRLRKRDVGGGSPPETFHACNHSTSARSSVSQANATGQEVWGESALCTGIEARKDPHIRTCQGLVLEMCTCTS